MTNIQHHLKSNGDASVRVQVTPASAGWKFLHFKIVALKPGETYSQETNGDEMALTPLRGRARVNVKNQAFELARRDVFAEPAHVLYVPPRQSLTVRAASEFEFALGGAPAAGKYPVRLFAPNEMKQELRGGGACYRQVNHILQHPLPAERLILFEVYVPAGAWSGWPPHCHDGHTNSPYLEETYYYRFDRSAGFGIHRNYRRDIAFDELFAVRDGDLVLVTQGFHPSGATPAANMYFLNYLAGELLDDARGAPPVDDPDLAWIKQDWTRGVWQLPMFTESL
ncbi:MAG: 5-deoxy-glucuronate isomerase [Chloroflexi bacterium]|nr:5-deoxy-glucuronate isomerase [Chloroflexota bacterium]